MLKFATPVENTGIRTRNITLANLYENHKTGVIDDYMCIPCNSRRSATRQERISQCPKILTIVLSRNVDNEEGSIDSAVEFPLERVCPSTYHNCINPNNISVYLYSPFVQHMSWSSPSLILNRGILPSKGQRLVSGTRSSGSLGIYLGESLERKCCLFS